MLPAMFGAKVVSSNWIFCVLWGGIHVYTALWMVYALTLLWRKSGVTSYLYYDPTFIPLSTYLCFAVTSIAGAFWLHLSDQGLVWENLIAVTIMLGFIQATFFTAVYGLSSKHRQYLKAIGKGREVKLTIGLVHNGIGMYQSWLILATLESVAITMVSTWGADTHTAWHVCLGVLTLVLIVWVIVDNFVIYKRTKYIFTPYIVFLIGSIGIAVRKNTFGLLFDPVNIFILIHMGLGSLAFVLKTLSICVRESADSSNITWQHKYLTSMIKDGNTDAIPFVNNQMGMTTMGYPFKVSHNQLVACHGSTGTLLNTSRSAPQQLVVTSPAHLMVTQPTPVMTNERPVMMTQPQPMLMTRAPATMHAQNPHVVIAQPTLARQAPLVVEQTKDGKVVPLKQIRPQVYMSTSTFRT